MVETPGANAPELVESIRKNLPTPQRIVVTGGSGFVGARLCNALAAAGHQVTGAGRNPYRAARPKSVVFKQIDLRDANKVADLCQGQDLLFHAGADSSPWGTRAEMHQTNVQGTVNVLEGCRQHNVRMVHVSTSAVFFEYRDRENLTDNSPLARRFACHYAESKAKAESKVQESVAEVDVVTVRARAVFGPGDNSLLPRIVGAATTGRLRVIGDGANRIDMTYVDNLLHGLVLAAAVGQRGEAFTVTNDQPVELWTVVADLLKRLGLLAPNESLRRVPYWIAMLAARASEWKHQWRRMPGEPAITRYSVGLLAKTQTFDITEAKQKWGYQPLISMSEGLDRTVADWQLRDEAPSETKLSLRLFSTGFTTARRRMMERGADWRQIRVHATCALIEHPEHGLLLFDTGYAPRIRDATRRWPYRLYRWTMPMYVSERTSIVNVLRQEGVNPNDVRRLVISHFHADHVGGLRDFPNAEVIATHAAWLTTRHRGFRALRRIVLPDLQPDDLEQRLHTLDVFHDPGWGPFEACHDLFDDGSIRLFQLPGHARGQIGALVNTDDGEVFLVADAAWTKRTLSEPLPLTLPFRAVAVSTADAKRTCKSLHQVAVLRPEIRLVPTHCPETARQWNLDEQLERCDPQLGQVGQREPFDGNQS